MSTIEHIALFVLAAQGDAGVRVQPNSPNTDTFLRLVSEGLVAGRDGKLFLTARGLRATRNLPEPVKCAL
jgi:hypothetical protein